MGDGTKKLLLRNGVKPDNTEHIMTYIDMNSEVRPKKIKQVLEEQNLWIPGLIKKCNTCKKTKPDPNNLNCCASHILSAQPDFTTQKSHIREVGEKAMTYLLKNKSIFIYLSNSSYLQVTSKKVQLSLLSISFEEVSSQELFKEERTFERVLSQKTFEETTPQDIYREIQHKPEIFISDLEILNDEASFQVTSKGKDIFKGFSSQETFIERMPQDMYIDLENLNNMMSSQEIFKGNRFLK
ncbi:26314_t:CDS:2, partial [Racocetra persica]